MEILNPNAQLLKKTPDQRWSLSKTLTISLAEDIVKRMDLIPAKIVYDLVEPFFPKTRQKNLSLIFEKFLLGRQDEFSFILV